MIDDDRSFGVATFNLENFDWSRAHELEFARRIAVLRPILNDLAADVICLQEVVLRSPRLMRAPISRS